MTKSRAMLTSFACATVLALSATAANAADPFKTLMLTDMLITGATEDSHNDLPAPPPKFTATPGPRRDTRQGSDSVDPSYIAGHGAPSSGKVQRVPSAIPDTRDPVAKQKPKFAGR